MKKKIFLLTFLCLSFFLSGCSSTTLTKNPSPATPEQVPLPTGEDVIQTFFELINEKRVPEAVEMLSATAAPEETTKQTWAVNFNTLEVISVKSIEPWQKENWTENQMVYKVVLVTQVKTNPQFYAWDNGENTKWINLVKENNLWKIASLASGP